MTPEERELLDKLVQPLEWVRGGFIPKKIYKEMVFPPFHVCALDYEVKFRGKFWYAERFGEIHNDYFNTIEEAKAACRTHQLEQVRKIFGDEGMAELREMHKAKQILDELRPVK